MSNLHLNIRAKKMYWIKLLLNNKTIVPYQYLSTFVSMTLSDYLKCNNDAIDLPQDIPNIYKEFLKAWKNLKPQPILKEMFW